MVYKIRAVPACISQLQWLKLTFRLSFFVFFLSPRQTKAFTLFRSPLHATLFFLVCKCDFEDLSFFSTFKDFGPLTCIPCYATWMSITLQSPIFHSNSSHCVESFVKAVIAQMPFCFQMPSIFLTKRSVWLENRHVFSEEFFIPLNDDKN